MKSSDFMLLLQNKLYIGQGIDIHRVKADVMYSLKTYYTCVTDCKSRCTEKTCIVCIVFHKKVVAYNICIFYIRFIYILYILYTKFISSYILES